MKKLVFMFAAIVAVSFASCGGNTKTAETDNDSVPAVVEENDSNNVEQNDSNNVEKTDSTQNAE